MTLESTLDAPPERLRYEFGLLPSGVVAVCGLVNGLPIGMAASSFTSVSLDPPLVSFCAMHTSRTWEALRERPMIGISVLAEEHGDLCRKFAAPGVDRFADIAWQASPAGAVFLPGSVLWLECTPHQQVQAGDHTIVVLRIQGTEVFEGVGPLVFHGGQFRRLTTGSGITAG